MIFEIYNGVNENPEMLFEYKERMLEVYLKEILLSFPINRIRIRKNYSNNYKEISIDIELDSTITSEKIYNKIVYRIFKTLDIDLITLQNNGNLSNFNYYFYGEKNYLEYECSIFIDVPKKAYFRSQNQLK